MAKSRDQINKELTLYQCCLADKAYEYISKELTGQQDIDCEFNKVKSGVLIIEALKCPENILNNNFLTQTQVENLLEQLNLICGCIECLSSEDLLDDTTIEGLIVQEQGFIKY